MTKQIKPAERLGLVKEYYFSRKLREVAQMNAQGAQVISLAIGSPDQSPSKATIAMLRENICQDGVHGYQPTRGIPELRKAMAGFYQRFYGVNLNPDTEIQPLIGSKEGILHLTLAFVNPGDQVLVPNPGYPTYTSLPSLLGAEVIPYSLCAERQWQPDFEMLEQMDLSRVKMMWTNYPHMPTGANAQRATYEKLVDFARRKGIVVVNDNPYSFILNENPQSILQVEGAKDCCIELNSMSKSHNMPGWRVGFCSTNAEWISWILKVKSNIDSGTLRSLQLAAATAFDNTDEWHAQHNFTTYAERRTIAWQILDTLQCQYDRNAVGMFVWARIPDTLSDAEQLTERVLHEAKVFITPGFIFGSNGERYVRISLCASTQQMQTALKRIQRIFKA